MSSFDWSNPTVVRLIERYTQLNRKATPQDAEASRTVRQVAEYYASNYEGSFEFMVKMRNAYDRWQSLTPAQASGTINCLMADHRYRLAQAARDAVKAAQAPATEPLPLPLSEPTTYAAFKAATTPETQPVVSSNNPIEPVCPNGTFTVVLNERGEYRTIKLTDAPDTMGKPIGTQIASYLSGSDNEHDYTGFAFVSGSKIGTWSKFKADSTLTRALTVLLSADREKQIDMGEAYAIESGRCFRCGRTLTVETSVKRGMGPICAGKMGL